MVDVRTTTPNLGLIKFSRGHPVTDTDLATNMDAIDAGVLLIAKAIYDFDVDGGAMSAITAASNTVIPDNAVILGGSINSTTAVLSGGAGTVSIGTSAGSSATSIIGVTAKGTYSLNATLDISATFAAQVKMTAAGSILFTIGTADLTAGVIEVTLLYYVAAA